MHAEAPAPKVDVYMPWFVSDYLTSTALFSTLEHGAYSLLLFHMWTQGGTLPLEHDRLARAARVSDADEWAAIWRVIQVRFVPAGQGRITHPRLQEELEVARRLKTEATNRGRAGAEGRWGGKPRKPRRTRAAAGHQQAPVTPAPPTPAPPAPAEPQPPAEPPPAPVAPAPPMPEHMPAHCSSNALQSPPSKKDPDPERAHAPAEPEPDTWPKPKPEPQRFNSAVVRARGQPPPAPTRQLQLGPPPQRPPTRPAAKPAPAGSVYARWVDSKWKPSEPSGGWPPRQRERASREPGMEG